MEIDQLKLQATNLRKQIIEEISKNGGYLSSNLSCVDINVALHEYLTNEDKVYFCSEDLKLGYDLLTNSNSEVCTLSKVLVSCIARDLKHANYRICVVLNSAYIRSGKDLEALNEISKLDSQLLIIFNDDTMISQGIGFVDKVISNIRNTKTYNNIKDKAKHALRPHRHGDRFIEEIHNLKSDIRKTIMDEGIFGSYDIDYQGPIDGNNFNELIRSFEISSSKKYPTVIHCISQSGKGYKYAEACTTDYWHHVSQFDIESGKPLKGEVDGYKFVKHIIAEEIAKDMLINKNIVTLSCDRLVYDGVSAIFAHFPDRSFRTMNVLNQMEMAIQFSNEGYIPYMNLKASELNDLYSYFTENNLKMIIGLNNDIDSLSYLSNLEHVCIIECKDYSQIIDELNKAINIDRMTIFVYKDKIIKNS